MLWLIELELKLRLIDYQENLIKSFKHNEKLLVPLTSDQLIEVCLVNILSATVT